MTFEQARKHRVFQKSVDARALHREVLSLLSPTQKRRLEQIGLQQIGPHIWASAVAARRLGLSKAQQKEFLRVDQKESERYARGIQYLMRKNRAWFGTANRKLHAAKYAAHDRQFRRLGERKSAASRRTTERVLTPRQKALWKAMLGKPFNLKTLTYDTEVYASD